MPRPSTVPPTTQLIPDTHRLCTECWEVKPIERFRRRRKGSEERSRECYACHGRMEAERRARKRGKRVERFVRQTALERDLERVSAAVALMVEGFGSLEAFCSDWTSQLKAAMERRAGSQMVLQSFRALAVMLLAAERGREQREERLREAFERMSDAELEEVAGVRFGAGWSDVVEDELEDGGGEGDGEAGTAGWDEDGLDGLEELLGVCGAGEMMES